MIEQLKIRAHISWSSLELELLLFKLGPVVQPDQSIIMKPVAFATKIEYMDLDPRNNVQFEPAGYLHKSDAQTLMDDLWTAGVRPTEGSGSAGSMAAVSKHLEDMRKIAFSHPGLKQPSL